jgi:cyclic pyranopterin phosphate synthase
MNKLSHIDKDGKAKMVDTSDKKATSRSATATATVSLNAETFLMVKENKLSKGDVLTVAKIAGIQAAKKTSELVPLCHPLPLDHVDISFELDESSHSIKIYATCKTTNVTGVEMEAFVACSICAVTIYDMIKAVQKDAVISEIKLVHKDGGKSGEFIRQDT